MKCCRIIIISVLVLALASAQVRGFAYSQDLHTEKPDSCYIVLATDVSGSMNVNDPLVPDPEGKLQAIRDDAQLTFLQLLEHLHTRHYVGVCKFAGKIAYGFPGGSRKIVEQSRSLFNWQETKFDWRTLRQQLSTKKPVRFSGTRINEAMEWAYQRILLTRKWCKDDGPGVLVILTDGDPDNALKELSPRGSLVLRAADKLASENIRVYPIIINTASYRPGRVPSGLDSKNKAAERLMELVAAKTDGKAYQITATFGLLDIFLDILNINLPSDVSAPVKVEKPTGSFVVSKYHRTAILIGQALESIRIEPFDGKANRKSYSFSLTQGVDSSTGIIRKIIPLARWNIVILRRPENSDHLRDFWCGRWRPVYKDSAAAYRGRVYLITDFLVRIAIKPKSPCWAFERIRIEAQLLERPEEPGEHDFDVPPLKGQDLSLQLVVNREDGRERIEVETGKWDSTGRMYTSDSLRLRNVGQYNITCDCVDHVNGLNILLGQFSGSFSVEPCPVSLTLRESSADVLVIPGGKSQQSSLKARDEFHAELKVTEGSVRPDALSGLLYLNNVKPQKWPFKHDVSGRFITDTFVLPEDDDHLVGHAEVKVKTSTGIRQMQLPDPDFDVPYNREALRLERNFFDLRKTLWVGEFHRQKMGISIFPVFEDSARRIMNSFPQELPEADMNVFDNFAGTSKMIPIRCSIEGSPQQVGDKGRKIAATYTLKSDIPIPPSNSCEIDPGTVIAGLRAEKAHYDVIDPIENGIFVWHVFQEPSEASTPGVANVIFRSEPISFAAEWKPNQNISAVSFEIQRASSNTRQKLPRVNLRLVEGTTSAQTSQTISELQLDETYRVIISVTLLATGADAQTDILLFGGEFRVEDYQPPRLKELVVGSRAGEDISCHALEEIELPLYASFTGYVSGNPQHSQLIEEFKKSCTLNVTSESGDTENISRTIEWRKVQPVIPLENARGIYQFEGYAVYTPKRTGPALVELGGEVEVQDRDDRLRNVQIAHARLFIKEPRFSCEVKEKITNDDENLLFDSDKFTAGEEAVFPARNSYETHLRVLLQLAHTVPLSRNKPCKIGLKIEHQPSSGVPKDEEYLECELTEDRRSIDLECKSLKEEGEYHVHLFAIDAEPSHPKIDLITPTLVSIPEKPDVVEKIMPVFLTEQVRQWPFQYDVRIQPDWPFRPDNLAFQFQLPGMKDCWFDGSVSLSEDGNNLEARCPGFLPELKEIVGGNVDFRLHFLDVDRITWKSRSSVQVVAPRLEGIVLIRESDGHKQEFEESRHLVEVPVRLKVRPKFRDAPELAKRWLQKEVKIYVCKNPGGDLRDGKATSKALKRLTELDAAGQAKDGTDTKAFTLQDYEVLLGANIIEEPSVHNCFWGWPKRGRRDTYVVLISATYEEKYTDHLTITKRGSLLGNSLITEWSAPYCIIIKKPQIIPHFWILVAGLLTIWIVVWIIKKYKVTRIEDLGLEVRLISGSAIVKPTSTNRMLVNVQQTRWSNEVSMYSEYLHRRWGLAWRPIAKVLAHFKVFLSRLFLPRHRVWISIRPRIKEGAEKVQMQLVCIWTGLINKNGRLWISKTGSEKLPDKGTPKLIEMNLSFRIENIDRNMPVTIQVKCG